MGRAAAVRAVVDLLVLAIDRRLAAGAYVFGQAGQRKVHPHGLAPVGPWLRYLRDTRSAVRL